MKSIKLKMLFLSAVIMATVSITAFAAPDRLSTQQWRLVQINGQRVSETNAFLEINIGQTRFMGNAGCNQMSGSVAVIGQRLNFSRITTTKKSCNLWRLNRTETQFIRALNDVTRYRQVGDNLELFVRNRLALRFAAIDKGIPDDDNTLSLANRKWVLEAIGNRRTFAPITGAFVVFDPRKGSAGGNTGCNVFGGSYTSSRNRINLTEIISTMRACEQGDRMEVERQFKNGLEQSNRYEIRDNRLFLYRDTRLLLTLRGERK